MTLKQIKKLVNTFYPKIEKYYGYSKFKETTPFIEYENDDFNVDAEFDFEENSIYLYYRRINTTEDLIRCLIHEYTHYLQSPSWYRRYQKMGYDYETHPYEIHASLEEENFNVFLNEWKG